MDFKDKLDNVISLCEYETIERQLAAQYIQSRHKVLELGARYGTVSCTINALLDNPQHHLAVEPDPSVISALMANRASHNCSFQIFEGAISNGPLFLVEPFCDHKFAGWGNYTQSGAGDFAVATLTLQQAQDLCGCRFDFLVADCEGALQKFLEDNRDNISQFEGVIFEQDGDARTDYAVVESLLQSSGLSRVGDFGNVVYLKGG